jgi:Ca-activated chloride channel family protein
MVSFEYPMALALCLVPPAFAVFRAVRSARRSRRLVLPLDLWNGTRTADAPAFWRLASMVSSLFSGLAWMALALAAAGPAGESGIPPASNVGIDFVFAIDASPSMAASDLDPTRLEAAKAFVRAYVESPEGAAGASVGLVAFGAEAALACPPTTDYATVLERLDAIKPGILGDGTALGLGLSSALRQLAASGSPGAVAVLLSDGEDNVGLLHPADAARALDAYGAGLLVVGLGSRGDVPIDYVDPATGQRMSGAYRSGFDDAAMSSIASAGGGIYRTVSDTRGLDALVAELGSLGAASFAVRTGSGAAGAQNGALMAGGTMPGGGGAVKRPVGRPLFLAAMVLAAAGWAIRRLLFGGLA